MHYHVFLSYSHKDVPVMRSVAGTLRRAGLRLWTDEGIVPGTASWQRAIEESILRSGCLVCILTPNAAQSDWVREELNFARTHKKQIFLLLAIGDERTSVPFGFTGIQWIDIRTRSLYRTNMRRLILLIRRRLGTTMLEDPSGPAVTAPLPEQPVPVWTAPPEMAGLLPEPFDWCEVSPGSVTIENQIYRVSHFFMAKYPITNTQYRVFAEADDGYCDENWWDFSAHAMQWRAAFLEVAQPPFPGDDLPCTLVSWYEAVAFCRWLSHRTMGIRHEGGYSPITLPTEQQWQHAAQGDGKRAYPWGKDFEKTRCNTLKSDIHKPTPVNQYPTGASPFGILDMVGNVGEWCLTAWGQVDIDMTIEAARLLRGGAWDVSRSFARTVSRDYAMPDQRLLTAGFRVCFNPSNTASDTDG